MIIFEFDLDDTWYLGSTSCTQEDKQHSNEIYQQIDANTVGWGIGIEAL